LFENLTDIEHLSESEENREYMHLENYDFKRRSYCPLCRGNLSNVDTSRGGRNTSVKGVCRRCSLLVNLTVVPIEGS